MHIREGTGGNHNEINQRPNAEATGGQQIEHSSACLAHIKAVDAEAAKEKTEKEGLEDGSSETSETRKGLSLF